MLNRFMKRAAHNDQSDNDKAVAAMTNAIRYQVFDDLKKSGIFFCQMNKGRFVKYLELPDGDYVLVRLEDAV